MNVFSDRELRILKAIISMNKFKTLENLENIKILYESNLKLDTNYEKYIEELDLIIYKISRMLGPNITDQLN